ncbi:DUF4148 domain-containing protein [Burkholderia anthina]|uniref:DUF4148 domain-containing protein n=1 Tax=Burkholderia anthina TaxID=179879 RepID=UPI0009BDD5FF|nr:DUF4148 domain-containing protein [Burkholderia anthina]
MSKSILASFIAVAAFASSFAAFAQSAPSLSRAQVEAELIELRHAGYETAGDQPHYPERIQEAVQRVASTALISATSHGTEPVSSSRTGSRRFHPRAADNPVDIYRP